MRKILMTSALFASFFTLSTGASATEVSFKAGSSFEAVKVSGSIGVWCPSDRIQGASDFRTIYCSANLLLPGEFSKVVYSGDEAADEVKVSVTHGSGKRVTKSSKLKDGVSTKNINLWVRTLFQRPLLDYGHNQVEYSLTQRGSLVSAGTFDVDVDSLPDRRCRYRTYNAPSPSACNNFSLCNRYFADENYCE